MIEDPGSDANTLEEARQLLRRNIAVVPIPRLEKGPTLSGWTDLKVKESELAKYFSNNPNIGIILGTPSKGLVDIDCDVPEASAAALILLPSTDLIHGRPSNPTSHFYFFCDLPPAPKKFTGLDGKTIVEIRSTGQQTLAPPSVHPSGEIIRWERRGDPTHIESGILVVLAERIAAAALLARSWPAEGQRNDAANALAGMLLRAGWTEPQTEKFMEAVATGAKDEETRQRVRNVLSTAGRLATDKSATGVPTFARIMGANVVDRVSQWLRLVSLQTAAHPASSIFVQQWPEPLAEEAFHGVAGEIIRAIEPHTESDTAALLIQFLVAFGNVISRSAHFAVEGDRHFGNQFVVIVGTTAKGRKGTSWSRILEVFRSIDPVWASERIQPGLSSGEGLIWSVRDEILGRNKKGEPELIDEGVSDKRLLAFEAEFASVLHILDRDGNTLSPILREAWDRGDLRYLTKHAPAKASGAHISVISHITRDELLRSLNGTERANGFANRFLFVCARRSKILPEGGAFDITSIEGAVSRLREAVESAKFAGRLERDQEAKMLWAEIYPDLSEGKPGLLGAVTSRAEAQVVRLSLLYSLLDRSMVITRRHLEAALAVWRYVSASTQYIFGEMIGDPVADEILRALRADSNGLTRSDISRLFGRHKTENEIERALRTLAEQGLAMSRSETTGGRPAIRWTYLGPAKKAK